MDINVIYEDDAVLALEKAQGVPVQPDKTGDDDLKTTAEKLKGTDLYVINRLDRPVGGIVLFAKGGKHAAKLTDIMLHNGFKKYYMAVVCGFMEDKDDFLKDYMYKNSRLNKSEICGKDKKGAKEALLEYNVLREIEHGDYGKLSLLKIHLLTGRHHQIRLQFSSRGFPIVGDSKYNGAFAGDIPIALWSYCMSFDYNSKSYNIKSEPKGGIFNEFL